MSEKTFTFEDGSLARFIFKDGALTFFIQAKHAGEEIKTTSTTVGLTPGETVELLTWAANQVIQEETANE